MPEVKLQPCFLTPKRMQPQSPLFIYLPGMDGTGELLRSQTDGLEVAFDVRALAIPRNDLTDWDMLSSSVLNLIRIELDANQNKTVYLCGESFGGCLAQKVAVKAPGLFKRVILINPASSFQLRPWYGWASQFTNLVPEYFYDVGALGLLPFLAALSRITRSDRQELLKTMRTVPSKTVLWRLDLLREFHVYEQELQRLTQLVLLIASADDRLLPSLAEVRRLVNILPNAKMVVLPNSGHACLLEKDINLYEILLANNFLEKDVSMREELEVKN
ncbi:MAG: alpha/beta hydrolase [Cyanomargarita calcarea GSE-NOS-MK-12-04C]|jgi:pimeloyl-ACP methyl ester carboxylesterase|uniref:Alpha/beta hydrolase n=1 Tax=Cyanomargarita calcarea GSE-NOS-MK-12-04C TaxID=2839659 RepID=A0A951QT59_9CYAN|nr:alpha/beta hydrolase [Cyanomargarita calcarea GSE-NOS-MK-12-04C]